MEECYRVEKKRKDFQIVELDSQEVVEESTTIPGLVKKIVDNPEILAAYERGELQFLNILLEDEFDIKGELDILISNEKFSFVEECYRDD